MNAVGPTISALTVLHNRRHLLAETIQSVLDQSYPVTEFVIIDDGSTDDPLSLISQFNDERIRYYYYDRIGVLSKLRNLAVYKAACDYCAFIDSDDLWHKDKLKLCVEETGKSDPVLVLSDCHFFAEDGLMGDPISKGMLRKEDVFWELTERNHSFAFGTNFFFRNLPGVTVFDESLWVGDHDFVTFMCAFHKTVYLDRVLNYIRRHPGNMSRPNHVLDYISPLEYNRTIKKLFDLGRIDKKKYKTIRAANYIKISLVYYNRKRFRRALQFATASLNNRFTWPSFKFLVKVLLARLSFSG